MNKSADSASAAHPLAQRVSRQPAYSQDARSYDHRTGAFQAYRQAIVAALPLRRGQVVLDVGCGTGLCYGLLLEKVGPQGGVIGIEESPQMAAIARERIAREGWHNVTVVQSGAEDAQIAATADAALFCAVHDILQSPDALRNVMNLLRPGAQVAVGGGKWAAPWMVAVNMQARMLHAPYVRSFEGFDRPWNHLEQLVEDIHVRELAFGSGYVLTGRSRRSRRPDSRQLLGAAGSGIGLSSMTSGCPNSRTTAAFISSPRDASEPIVRPALRWRGGPRVVTMAGLLSAFG
jgi:demethylmenaquinone methyltransferase/2-methoxy-6-polyprenyl-1,4-benzoquinol methylase